MTTCFAVFLGVGRDVRQELGRDIDGVDLSARPDLFRHQPREQAGACTDVSHDHSRLEPKGCDDLVPPCVWLSFFRLELLDVSLHIGLFESVVDLGVGLALR